MMNTYPKPLLILAMLVAGLGPAIAQLPSMSWEQLIPEDYQLSRDESYDGTSLWGYMNGGADLYLEYGFEKLWVKEYKKEGEILKLEFFRMNKPLNAYGIFSVNRYKCDTLVKLPLHSCLSPYQLQLCFGNWYISISNTTGQENDSELAYRIAKNIRKDFDGDALQLPHPLNNKAFSNHTNKIKYIKGRLGLQNALPSYQKHLGTTDGFSLFYIPMAIKNNKIRFFRLEFNDDIGLNEFINSKNISINNNKLNYKDDTGTELLKGKILKNNCIIFCEAKKSLEGMDLPLLTE